MKSQQITITFTCNMCGRIANMKHDSIPSRWEAIANKHYCSQCKRLVGARPVNLSTTNIRKCLLVAPIRHIRGLK
jgi:hypothetical protein